MILAGIDEVGRGCWAGPLVAGAVLWDDSVPVPSDASWRLTDSKQLTKLQRMAAEPWLRQMALAYGTGWVMADELDAVGLTAAVGLAMRRALQTIVEDHGYAGPVIIDGSYNFLQDIAGSRAVVKADGSIPAVSAASILAKTARDDWMCSVAAPQYPRYGFERHVGYGTALHRQALASFGVTPLHRRSFRPVAQAC